MAGLDKKWTTGLFVAATAFVCAAGVTSFFASPAKKLQTDIGHLQKKLQDDRAVLAKKSSVESEWQSKKDHFNPGLEPDAVLNAWVKDLLSFAQSQALAIEKLEPAGAKAAPDGKNLAVFVSFRGDVRQFIGFIYNLAEKDPLSRVESFGAKREEEAKVFLFELMLGKTVR